MEMPATPIFRSTFALLGKQLFIRFFRFQKIPSMNPVLTQLEIQCGTLHAQNPLRAVRTADPAFRFLQNMPDVSLL